VKEGSEREGGGEGSLCAVYLYLVGQSSTRGNARNDGGGVLFFLFSFSLAWQARPHNKDTTSLAG